MLDFLFEAFFAFAEVFGWSVDPSTRKRKSTLCKFTRTPANQLKLETYCAEDEEEKLRTVCGFRTYKGRMGIGAANVLVGGVAL